jgi:DNA-binding response OmpR family regulator
MARILVVDDELNWRRLMRQVLEEFGHEVYTYATADVALRVLDRLAADVAVLDVRMVPSGKDTLARMRTMVPGMPVIMCSSFSGTRCDRGLASADAFCVKRPGLIELVEQVELVHQKYTRGSRHTGERGAACCEA